jgi:hypothetical protein
MVLAIADSYYWNIFNTRIPKNLFKNEAFWYFNKQIYPDFYFKPKHVEDINLKKEIEQQEVILLMVTERFLFKFGWNFIEDVYKLYGPTSFFDKMHDYKSKIWNYNTWFTGIINDSKKRNNRLDEMLNLSAEYVYGQDDMEELLTYVGPQYFANNLRHDAYKFENIKAKAHKNNLPVDTVLQGEARNIFQSKYPEIYKKYYQLENIKLEIANDSLLLKEARQLSEKYFLTLEEAVQIKAETKFKKSN